MRPWMRGFFVAVLLLCPASALASSGTHGRGIRAGQSDRPPGRLLAGPTKPAKPTMKAKYYFNLGDVTSENEVDSAVKEAAREALAATLAERPEFTSDLGDPVDAAELEEALARRKLRGFNVNLKIVSFSKEPLPPKPGGRLPQLAVGVKLSVFGTTIPDAKLAFGGAGEAVVQAEVVERRMDEEAATLTGDALAAAVNQAVNDAVAKLGKPVSAPMNESKKRRRKKP